MTSEAAPSSAGNKKKPDSQDIIIDGKNYYHPFPSAKNASLVWRAFQLDHDLDYQETNKVFCMKCPQKSADGKTKLHFEKWKQGTTTEAMRRHIQRHHLHLLKEPEEPTPKHSLQPLFKDKWPASKCIQFTKKMTYDLVIQDKEPLALFERKGFRRFIRREFPGYSIPDRDKVAQIADDCGTESRDAVILALKEHFSKHGTVSSDIDAWTRRRRKFVGNGLSWVERPSWKFKRAIASCASLPVGISVRASLLRDTIDNGYQRLQIPKERVFAEVSDEGSDMAAAIELGGYLQSPCGAHVQQSSMKDIYINEIKEPKMKKDESGFKENSGTRWPNGDRLTASEIADLTEIRKIVVKKSEDLHDSIMRVEFLHLCNKAGS